MSLGAGKLRWSLWCALFRENYLLSNFRDGAQKLPADVSTTVSGMFILNFASSQGQTLTELGRLKRSVLNIARWLSLLHSHPHCKSEVANHQHSIKHDSKVFLQVASIMITSVQIALYSFQSAAGVLGSVGQQAVS